MADKGENKIKRRGWHGDPEGHARAGRKGGQVSGGNFKNNPKRASEAGKIGGQRSRRTPKEPSQETTS